MTPKAFSAFQLPELDGRYLPPEKLNRALDSLGLGKELQQIGTSVTGRGISYFELGTGPVRVLLWSQMHGNESTTTRALLDSIKFIQTQSPGLLGKLRLGIVPILNPDGALAYTRENANGIDLNRDAINQSQPESKALRSVYESFSPHFCFNLHDQRTIYNVGGTSTPATLSFLAPAHDQALSIGYNRGQAMRLIAAIHRELSSELPRGIGLYDDSFNPNCVGDSFQQQGSATILFEAGHYPGDYQRKTTRYFVFRAIMTALEQLANQSYLGYSIENYQSIPENTKDFVDILIQNPGVLGYQGKKGTIAVQYLEELSSEKIIWTPQIADPELSTATYGHRVLDATNSEDRNYLENSPELLKLLKGP